MDDLHVERCPEGEGLGFHFLFFVPWHLFFSSEHLFAKTETVELVLANWKWRSNRQREGRKEGVRLAVRVQDNLLLSILGKPT